MSSIYEMKRTEVACPNHTNSLETFEQGFFLKKKNDNISLIVTLIGYRCESKIPLFVFRNFKKGQTMLKKGKLASSSLMQN